MKIRGKSIDPAIQVAARPQYMKEETWRKGAKSLPLGSDKDTGTQGLGRGGRKLFSSLTRGKKDQRERGDLKKDSVKAPLGKKKKRKGAQLNAVPDELQTSKARKKVPLIKKFTWGIQEVWKQLQESQQTRGKSSGGKIKTKFTP